MAGEGAEPELEEGAAQEMRGVASREGGADIWRTGINGGRKSRRWGGCQEEERGAGPVQGPGLQGKKRGSGQSGDAT